MFDFIMTDEQLKLRDEARAFTKWVPKEMILDMDAEKIQFPQEYLKEAGKRNLLGIRLPKELGGRGLGWVEDGIVAEEVGVASYSLACLWGVGADIVCEAIAKYGSDELKQEVVVPLLKGEVYAAECLTEPRGGSDFFGAATTARKDGGDWIINGQKRFIVGAEGADWFMVYAATNPEAPAHERMTCFIVPRDAGVESKYIYGLMGVRGGGAGRVIFDDVRVPERYALNGINGGFPVFQTNTIPERLGTALMTIGSVR
ncbi:MAG TPA: acyl-CoA dehydrogenase family protein, partial [Spirochaetota bacterium]|nr:acyl-CoA dehydrogenase family protein [Spirochaetota bacterium]